MSWDERDVRLNWRDDTLSAVMGEETPTDRIDEIVAGWAASGLPFADYLARFSALGVE